MPSEDAVRAAIARQEKWHHTIEVAPGIFTPGMQDTATVLRQIDLPEDLTGKRVLDIGARDGFFTFEAERRGAREVVAIDNEPPEHTGFAIAAELLGSEAQYVTENVYSLNPAQFGRFDVVLFLGVIYHLRHPLLALDRIHDVCGPDAQLFVETHMLDEGLVDGDGNFHKLDAFNVHLRDLPLVEYMPGAMLGKDSTSQWSPSRVALDGWLVGSGFAVERLWQEAFRGGATGRRVPLAANGERAVDEASAWSMDRGQVLKRTVLGPEQKR